MDIQNLLEKSCRTHSRLCPRQVLGVRLGLAGLRALGFAEAPAGKRLLVISETDGCFVDGLSAATDCAVGHRTLRVQDYGKAAAVFVDTLSGQAVRVAPALDIRAKADLFSPDEMQPYLAQMRSYQSMPDEDMFRITPVSLVTPLEEILSQPGLRVPCARCGEEIMNGREVEQNGLWLCQACAHGAYYRAVPNHTPEEQR